MNSYDRRESIPVTVTLTSDGTTALDTSNFVTITVKVTHKHLGSSMGRYSLVDSSVTKESPTTDGQITFICEDSETANAPLGVYKYQVKTTETDADYESSIRTRTFVGDCFYLKKALT